MPDANTCFAVVYYVLLWPQGVPQMANEYATGRGYYDCTRSVEDATKNDPGIRGACVRREVPAPCPAARSENTEEK